MSNSTGIVLAAAAFFLTRKAQKTVTAAKSLKLQPVWIELKNLKEGKLFLQIINPSEIEFKIQSLSANVYFKDSLIATVNRVTPFTIKPTFDNMIALDLSLKSGEAIAAIISLLFNKEDKYKKIKVLGAYKYMGLTFAIDNDINIRKPKK